MRAETGRGETYRAKVSSRKELHTLLISVGSLGGSLDEAMWKSAETCVSQCDQGGLPVSISIIVQPTDQMSACRPWPVCLITSGAIQ